jgi:hypothetical protein
MSNHPLYPLLVPMYMYTTHNHNRGSITKWEKEGQRRDVKKENTKNLKRRESVEEGTRRGDSEGRLGEGRGRR